MGKLFVISGSSGVGKGTVIKEFLKKKHPEFKLSVSCTTRSPREGEIHGINYFFLSKDEFKTCIEQNEFFRICRVFRKHVRHTKSLCRSKTCRR